MKSKSHPQRCLSRMRYNALMKYLKRLDPSLLICEKKGKTNYYNLNLQALDRRLLEQKLKEI